MRITRAVDDRLRNTLIALVFGVIAAVLVVAYVHSYKHHVDSRAALVNVLVASSDLAPGASGAGAQVRVESIPRSDAVPGAVASKSEIQHLVVSQQIYTGEQLTMRRFSSSFQTGIRGQVAGNLRLMEVTGDNNQLLAGTLQAGDRVDVVASIKVPTTGGGEVPVARTILTNLRVIQPASKSSSAGISGGTGQASLTLAVTNAEAQKLFYVMKNADWSLLFRPPHATSTPATK